MARPNVVQRQRTSGASAGEPARRPASRALGYQSGQARASTICRQTASQAASTRASLCAKRSARSGSNPAGQWMSMARTARSAAICPCGASAALAAPVEAARASPMTAPAARVRRRRGESIEVFISYLLVMLEEADRSGVAQPPIKAALEGAVQRHDTIVVKGQDLGEERAGDLRHRIEPEVAIEETRPRDAACRTPVRSGLCVDVERQSPFVRLAAELVEAVRISRLGRAHLAHVQVADLVDHHLRNC